MDMEVVGRFSRLDLYRLDCFIDRLIFCSASKICLSHIFILLIYLLGFSFAIGGCCKRFNI
jgi:hypothetical protein